MLIPVTPLHLGFTQVKELGCILEMLQGLSIYKIHPPRVIYIVMPLKRLNIVESGSWQR